LPYTKYGCVRAPSTLRIILRLIVQFIFLQFLNKAASGFFRLDAAF